MHPAIYQVLAAFFFLSLLEVAWAGSKLSGVFYSNNPTHFKCWTLAC